MSDILEGYWWLIVGTFFLLLIIGCCAVGPRYNVWQSGLAGKADLKRAEWDRRIGIAEAEAVRDSAILLAQAEAERAKGVAEANKIIGNSLKDNDSYLRYLWIQGLHDKDNNTIYIPTEAGLPILEAGKRRNMNP